MRVRAMPVGALAAWRARPRGARRGQDGGGRARHRQYDGNDSPPLMLIVEPDTWSEAGLARYST